MSNGDIIRFIAHAITESPTNLFTRREKFIKARSQLNCFYDRAYSELWHFQYFTIKQLIVLCVESLRQNDEEKKILSCNNALRSMQSSKQAASSFPFPQFQLMSFTWWILSFHSFFFCRRQGIHKIKWILLCVDLKTLRLQTLKASEKLNCLHLLYLSRLIHQLREEKKDASEFFFSGFGDFKASITEHTYCVSEKKGKKIRNKFNLNITYINDKAKNLRKKNS